MACCKATKTLLQNPPMRSPMGLSYKYLQMVYQSTPLSWVGVVCIAMGEDTIFCKLEALVHLLSSKQSMQSLQKQTSEPSSSSEFSDFEKRSLSASGGSGGPEPSPFGSSCNLAQHAWQGQWLSRGARSKERVELRLFLLGGWHRPTPNPEKMILV